MDSNQAEALLRQAEDTTTQARQAGKWFARYLAIFGIASIPLSLLVAWSHGRPSVAIPIMLGWVVLVAVAAIWSARQRGALMATKKISAVAFVAWGIAWGITVSLGASFFADSLLWWLAGGVVMAVIMFGAAAYATRRAR